MKPTDESQSAALSGAVISTTRKYWAFISYSHVDRRWGEWLHKSLENYRIPKRLIGRVNPVGETVPSRLFPVFRDRDELPTSADLGGTIRDALLRSQYLIVICSPSAASSHWVDAEIRFFKRLGRESRIFTVVVDGTPDVSEVGMAKVPNCYPPALRSYLGPSGERSAVESQPLAADVRQESKQVAVLRLVAGILGVSFDDLRQRDLHRRRIRGIIAGGLGLMVVGSIAGGSTYISRLQNERDALRPAPIPIALRRQQSKLATRIQRDSDAPPGVEIISIDTFLVVSFSADRAFKPMQPEFTESGRGLVEYLARVIANVGPGFLREIRVYAHTDSRPFAASGESDNWALSSARATAVVRTMIGAGLRPTDILS